MKRINSISDQCFFEHIVLEFLVPLVITSTMLLLHHMSWSHRNGEPYSQTHGGWFLGIDGGNFLLLHCFCITSIFAISPIYRIFFSSVLVLCMRLTRVCKYHLEFCFPLENCTVIIGHNSDFSVPHSPLS